MALKAPVIAGKYTLLRKLGAGGMAEVFLAKQVAEGGFEKLVVIKRILPHLASGPSNTDFVNMFLDEARLASDLRHPNIVTVIDVGKTSETYFIVMEFLHGQDVRKVQRKNAAWREMVPFGQACQMIIDAATGLHYAHTKKDLNGKPLDIVHRDVSPQNIIVTYEGSTKIVDFGIAKASTQTTHTSTGVLKGKYTYMSPEQAAGEPVDARTDQFALGIVFWELLTMRRLFKRDTEMLTLEAIMHGNIPRPSRFRDDVPKSIDDVAMKALAREKKDRFLDCEEFALALEDALAKEQIVHSQARLAQYMRRLFADTLAEEATLGLVNPDGSLSKNLTPFTLPPPPDEEDKAVPDPVTMAKEEQDKEAPVDATTADRKSARSDTSSRATKKKERPPEPKSVPTASDLATDPTVVDHTRPRDKPSEPRPRDRDRDRGRDLDRDRDRGRDREPTFAPEGRRPSWMVVAIGVLAATLVVTTYLGYDAYAHSGPGNLIVRSEPRGAIVIIDGETTNERTPALLRDIEAGKPHKIRIELDGKYIEEIVTIPKRGATHEVTLNIP